MAQQNGNLSISKLRDSGRLRETYVAGKYHRPQSKHIFGQHLVCILQVDDVVVVCDKCGNY